MTTIAEDVLYAYAEAGGIHVAEPGVPVSHDDYVRLVLNRGDSESNLPNRQLFAQLRVLDMREIIAGHNVEEWDLDGEMVIDLVRDALKAVADGYAVHTWIGPDRQALAVAYRPDQLTILPAGTKTEGS